MKKIRRRRRRDLSQLERDLAKAKDAVTRMRKRMTREFLENAPEHVVEETKMRLAQKEELIIELEGRISQLRPEHVV